LGRGLRSHWKSSGLAIFAVGCLLGETTGSAHAQCNSFVTDCATEWSGSSVINLRLPGSILSDARSINDAGQAVGSSQIGNDLHATEWKGGSVINLGGLPGFTISEAQSINNAGQVVGDSFFVGSGGVTETATEWKGGSVINLGGLSGSTSSTALGINDAGQIVGESTVGGVSNATEWSGSSIINLGGLPGSTSSNADGINHAGRVVGVSVVGGVEIATEWIGENVINLGGLNVRRLSRPSSQRSTIRTACSTFALSRCFLGLAGRMAVR
jgi:probable HAF family extracellular repeat protein